MRLVRLEVRNYRSVESQSGESALELQGLNCFVGNNNAGKSNLLKALLYLLDKEKDEERLYYGHDTSRVIDVRGYFIVDESDFDLLKIDNKKEQMKAQVLDDGTIGICRRSDTKDIQVIGYYPVDPRLAKDAFNDFHGRAWTQHRKKFQQMMTDQYPELVPYVTKGKEANKGGWSDAYEELIRDRPDHIEFAEQPAPPKQGISADLYNMLPRVLYVPAVKEVSEVTKTTRSAELGGLLNELSAQVRGELDQAISEALSSVYRQLNLIQDASTGQVIDERRPGIRNIERKITEYISEVFHEVSVELHFPNPESAVLFDNTQVLVKEETFEKVTADSAGEGVKRMLIFSLIRTLADLRQGRLSLVDESERVEGYRRQSLLLLYEEAELFLHPGLQKILLNSLADLASGGDQVLFTTHSPFLIDPAVLDTIHLTGKLPSSGTFVSDFPSILNKRGPAQKNRLLEVQHVSSYIFSDRVVLVEGESDKIVLKKIARILDDSWDFDRRGIPVLSVSGRNNLPLFQQFLDELGIRAFAVTDIDALEGTVTNLMRPGGSNSHLVKKLVAAAEVLVADGVVTSQYNSEAVSELTRSHAWAEVFGNLAALYEVLTQGDTPDETQTASLGRLLKKKETDALTRALQSDDDEVGLARTALVDALLSEDVLLLNGTLENYYPYSCGEKVAAALEFDPSSVSRSELIGYFSRVASGLDMEVFLERVFVS